jgi:AcrR family transcriptional regulator
MEAAGELFYARGVGSTSVDDIAEASGLTKPTLYRHFPSKEALVAAYLDERDDHLDAELRHWIEQVPPRIGPRVVIDWLCHWIARPGFHGCAFVRTYAELGDQAARDRAVRRKRALLAAIEEACRAAEAREATALARELALIVEGATTLAYVSGDGRTVASTARRLGRLALRAHGL